MWIIPIFAKTHPNTNTMNSISFQVELPFNQLKTYGLAAVFILANVLLPQAFHAVPSGGKVFLPLFFFTLIAAARFGWKAGLLTAVFSPIISSALFGMPPLPSLPLLLIKGICLCAAVGLIFKFAPAFSWSMLFLAIGGAQLVGWCVDALFFSDPLSAWTTISMSWPGLFMQWLLGGLLLRFLFRSKKI